MLRVCNTNIVCVSGACLCVRSSSEPFEFVGGVLRLSVCLDFVYVFGVCL